MTASQDLWEALADAEDLPYGRSRTSIVEGVVARADALGEAALAWSARMALVECYAFGGEPLKEFAPFAWLLARYDAAPGEVDESDRHELFWSFKWVTVQAVSHPGVSLAQIEQGLADMQDRYLAAGEGPAPVLGCRYKIDAHVHGYAAATEAYLAWTRALRTELSDCRACEPTTRTRYLSAMGRHGDAVREAGPVLARGGCEEQPQNAIGMVLESLLLVGEAERAAAEHLRGVRLMRSRPGETEMWARHLIVLARSGRLMRGLDLLEDHLAEVDAPPSPEEGMWLAAAGARLLHGLADTGQGDLPVGPGQEPVAALAERLAATAQDWAAKFDARNGTPAIGQRVQDWLDAGELPDLPLDRVVTRRPASSPASPSMPASRPAPVPASMSASMSAGAGATRTAPTPADISRRFERSRVTQVRADWERALEDWRDCRPDSALPDGALPDGVTPAEAARLDAALAQKDLMAGRGDIAALVAAAERLSAAGDPGSGAFYRAAALREQVEARAADAGLAVAARVDELLADAALTCTPVETACLAVPVRGVLLTAGARGLLDGDEAQSRARTLLTRGLTLLEGAGVENLTPQQRGCLAVLLLESSAELQPQDRIAQLRRAWELLPAGTRATERAVVGLQWGGVLAEGGQLPVALAVLADVVVDGVTGGNPLLSARAWAMSGRIHRHLADRAAAGDDDDAADRGAAYEPALEAFWQADRLLPGVTVPEEVADNRHDLAYALIDAGRPLEAAEVAETAVQVLGEHLAECGLKPAADTEQVTGTDPTGDAVAEHLAGTARLLGTLSFAAATACQSLDEQAAALAHARRSASWHRRIGWDGARAEALGLVGQLTDDREEALAAFGRAALLYTELGRWREAARLRRAVVGTTLGVAGLTAAREAIAAAWSALDQVGPDEDERDAYTWERLALTEQAARVLLRAGQTQEGLELLKGLDDAYREVGDLGSVWDVALLRVDALDVLGQGEQAIAVLEPAAAQALAVGAPSRARELGGRLAVLLDALGRPDDAQAAWERFGGDDLDDEDDEEDDED